MRVSIFCVLFVLSAALFAQYVFAYSNPLLEAAAIDQSTKNQGQEFTLRRALTDPNYFLRETLRDDVRTSDYLRALNSLNTYFGRELYFKKEAVHNPFVWRQGGSFAPTSVPRGLPITGLPFDIHTPAGTIPGCLNLLCQPPQGAIWFAGTCWCTP